MCVHVYANLKYKWSDLRNVFSNFIYRKTSSVIHTTIRKVHCTMFLNHFEMYDIFRHQDLNLLLSIGYNCMWSNWSMGLIYMKHRYISQAWIVHDVWNACYLLFPLRCENSDVVKVMISSCFAVFIDYCFLYFVLHDNSVYQGLSARLQYLHCISNGVTAVLH